MEVSVGRLREGREGREEWKEGEREEGKAGGRDGNVTVKRYLVVYTRHPTYIHTTNAHTHAHTHTHTHTHTDVCSNWDVTMATWSPR